jgi:hypothetical protein
VGELKAITILQMTGLFLFENQYSPLAVFSDFSDSLLFQVESI